MLICNHYSRRNVEILELRKPGLLGGGGRSLHDTFASATLRDAHSVVVDAHRMKHISYADIGALVDVLIQFQKARNPARHVAVAGLCRRTRKRLDSLGLSRAIALYDDLNAALNAPSFRSVSLRGNRALLFCDTKMATLAPLTTDVPAPMLDFLGRPILERAIERMSRFGLGEFILNPGYLGHQIPHHFRSRPDVTCFYRMEHSDPSQGATHLATLAALHRENCIFETDTIVQMGTSISTIDYPALLDYHRDSDADVTVAKLRSEHSPSVVILRPSALEAVPKPGAVLPPIGLLEFFRQSGLRMAEAPIDNLGFSIRTGQSYFAALKAALHTPKLGITPVGHRIKQNLWVHQGARVEPGAQVDGPCYVGRNSTISADAQLHGTNLVGSECVVSGRSFLRDSVLMPQTQVLAGGILDQMIASPSWAINHRFADGSIQNKAPLDCTAKTGAQREQTAVEVLPFKKTA